VYGDLRVHFESERRIPYLGGELRPHYLLETFRVEGSAIAAWRGPCRVETGALVDWEDRLARDRIEAREMLHFLGEFFGISLREGVLLQRMMVALAAARLPALLTALGHADPSVSRDGDDLYLADGGKLSVSIVTASPVSVLLHLGLNIDASGAPQSDAWKTGALVTAGEPGDEISAFGRDLLQAVQSEWRSIQRACVKVRPVL